MDPVDGPILASLLGTFPYCANFQFRGLLIQSSSLNLLTLFYSWPLCFGVHQS